MKYDFDTVIDRADNFSAKYSELTLNFGRNDLLPMWVADMDFQSPRPIIDAIQRRAAQGIFGYVYRPDSYYQAMIDWYRRRYNLAIRPEWVSHSPGVVPTLSLIMREFAQPGDKVIIQPPVYYPFFSVVKDNGRQLVLNPLKKAGETYVMDYDDLTKKIDKKVKYLILCNPHNPAGRVWTKQELEKLGEICLKNNITVLADEIHGDLVFHNRKYHPFAAICDEFAQNSITLLSATKTFNLAGLQASFALFPRKQDYDKFAGLLKILDIKRNNCFSLVAAEAGYREGEEWLNQLLVYLETNIAYLNDYFRANIPQIKPNRPEGTYLVWLDCRQLGLADDKLEEFMVNKARVAMDGGNWFGEGGSGYMRMNVACPRATLTEGLRRIERAVKEYIH